MAKLRGDRLVAMAKVSAYLLNHDHVGGAAKAQFFSRFGFDASSPDVLLVALASHPDRNDVVEVQESVYGTKSVVECRIDTPDGRSPCIRSVWVCESGSTIHRLVTAYPR